jgi:hypothetical protein
VGTDHPTITRLVAADALESLAHLPPCREIEEREGETERKRTWRSGWWRCAAAQWGQMLAQQARQKMLRSFFLWFSCAGHATKKLSATRPATHPGLIPIAAAAGSLSPSLPRAPSPGRNRSPSPRLGPVVRSLGLAIPPGPSRWFV